MLSDQEMLKNICRDADMGRSSLEHVMDLTVDERLHELLDRQLAGYEKSYTAAEKLLHEAGERGKEIGPMAKMMANMSADMQTLTDRTPSKIAEMVIQGCTMGITTLTRQLHDYGGKGEIRSMAEKQIEMEQRSIEELKPFL